MTRTSGGRLAAAIIVGVVALPLSGCLYAQIPANPPAVDGPTSTPVPSDEPAEDGIPTTMSFADGADLPSTAYIQWGDGLMFDDGWKSVAPDDGNGGWTDGTIDDTCTARFWQGLASDVDMTPGDDEVSSDAVLAQVVGGTTSASVTLLATTVQLGYQTGGTPLVDARQLTGTRDGHDWSITARAFTATGAGVFVIVDCVGGDVDAVFDEIVEKNAIIITP